MVSLCLTQAPGLSGLGHPLSLLATGRQVSASARCFWHSRLQPCPAPRPSSLRPECCGPWKQPTCPWTTAVAVLHCQADTFTQLILSRMAKLPAAQLPDARPWKERRSKKASKSNSPWPRRAAASVYNQLALQSNKDGSLDPQRTRLLPWRSFGCVLWPGVRFVGQFKLTK